jgi:hypothetical protein
VDNLTWFAKVLIWLAVTALSALAVWAIVPAISLTLTFWEALVVTAVARVVPGPW